MEELVYFAKIQGMLLIIQLK